MTNDEALKYFNDNNYEFKNVSFLVGFDFIPRSIIKNLSFENCYFKAPLFVIGSNDPVDASNDRTVLFELCSFNKVLMHNTSNLHDISLYDVKIKEFRMNFRTFLPKFFEVAGGSEIHTIEISSVRFENKVIFKLQRLDFFDLYSSENTGYFCLTTYNGVRILKILEFTNSEYFELDCIRNDSGLSGRLSLSHSNFGSSKFNSVNSASYHSFDYYNNSINEVICNDCIWKTKFTDLDTVDDFEYFRNLRNLSEEGTFAHTEVNRRYLDLLFKRTSYSDKLILFFSKIISNHCTNWLLAVSFLIITNFFAVYLINDVLDYELLKFKDFAILMNPLHLYSHYSFWGKLTTSLPNSFYLLDVIFRGVNATILYHLVKTFRRFHS